MAEEHPESPTTAVRIYIAGFALACAFRAVERYEWPWTADSVVSAGLSAMLTVADWKLPWILQKAGPRATRLLNLLAADPRWWVASILVYLMVVTLSPFIEEKRWPFAAWFTPQDTSGIIKKAQSAFDAQRVTLIEWLQEAQRERDAALKQADSLKLDLRAHASTMTHYAPGEVDRMVKMLEDLNDIVEGTCTGASTLVSLIVSTWAGSVQTSEQLSSLSTKFTDARGKLAQCASQISSVMVKNGHYYNEVSPTIADTTSAIGSLDNALADMGEDVSDFSKANGNINVERFLSPKDRTLVDNYTKFSESINYARTKIAEKTNELREWHNQ